MSIGYYDRNAATFFADTVAADMAAERARFLRHVPQSGSILDAGCGSGRDAKAFSDAGYDVTAFDASIEMVRLATEHIGRPVLHMTFQEIEWLEQFDGIWASASLLHVPRRELREVFGKLFQSLRRRGVLYFSFKYGSVEREKDGRLFTDMTESTIQSFIPYGHTSECWISKDVRTHRSSEKWLNGLIFKHT